MPRPAALLLALVLSPLPCRAAITLYDNYSEDPDSPLNPYTEPAFGYQLSWTRETHWDSFTVAPQGVAYAVPFTNTLPVEAAFNSLSLALYKFPTEIPFNAFGDALPDNHDNLSFLLAGAGPTDDLPGEILETIAVNPHIDMDTPTFLTLTSTTRSVLKPGETYWIILQPTTISTTSPNSDTFYLWVQSKTDATYADVASIYNPFDLVPDWTGFFIQGDGPLLAPTLRITADPLAPIPEPATLPVLALSLFLFISRNRRRMSIPTHYLAPGLVRSHE
jgi:hypothetical protein